MQPPRIPVVVALDHTAALGGGETALAALAGEVDPARFEVRVLLLADGPLTARLRAQGTPFAVLPASARLTAVARDRAFASPVAALRNLWDTARLVPRIVRAIRAADARLVVANTLKAALFAAVAAPLAGRPWVWHLHDRLAPDYLPGPVVTVLRMLARRGPRIVIANSAASLATVPGARAVVGYPGVRVPTGPAAPEEADAPRVGDGHDADAPARFGLLGRIAPTKGQREFLQAARIVGETLPDARFAVLGDALFNDAAYADEVRGLPAALGLEGRVEFTGWLDDPRPAVAGLTALVHASPVPEPFGQVLVEAMLDGVPVIATDAGGAPEVLGSGPDDVVLGAGLRRTPFGLLAAPGDPEALAAAMTWLQEHPVERAALAEAAREHAARRFSLEVTARAFETAWQLVLDGRAAEVPRTARGDAA